MKNAIQQLQFELTEDYIEINNLLKVMGIVDSGGAGKMLVAQGNVKVDGQQELRKTAKIRANQMVSLGNVRIKVLAKSS
ncbi:RNA-binding S4 domain-containing protein [Sapientia aquatica]|uniref:RNA-binding S4 domain-containing protein n=1 Tax=Sapientia aquatica TaxID=1549640 RepID=UPI00267DC1DD